MLLNVSEPARATAARAMRKLIRDCHDSPKAKRRTSSGRGNCSARCWTAKSLSSFPQNRRGRRLRVNVALQDDFSMDQALSLFLLDTIPLLDPQAPDYALVLLTLVESIRGGPGHHPAQAVGQVERPENGGDENGGD
jgi:hypothetical protein